MDLKPGAVPDQCGLGENCTLSLEVVRCDDERPVPQPRVQRVAAVQGVVDVVAGCFSGVVDRLFQVLGQDLVPQRERGERASQVQHGGVVVHHIHAGGALPGVGVGEPSVRIPRHFPGEGDVGRGDGGAVPPGQPRFQLDRDGEAVAAIGAVLQVGEAILQGRDLGAELADDGAVGVERGDGALGEADDVVLDGLRTDEGVQVGGELSNPDNERILCVRAVRRQQQCREQPSSPKLHACSPTHCLPVLPYWGRVGPGQVFSGDRCVHHRAIWGRVGP